MRTRFLTRLINREVEDYLARRDVIFVPVGTVEMHGAMPLDCETVLPEAISLLLAERSDALVLPHLPYFYPGATAIGRGTVNISIRDGYDYLVSVTKALQKQGFRRIIFVSYHAPAALTIGPVVRDLFAETHMPLYHLDAFLSLYKYTQTEEGADINMEGEHEKDIHLAAYDILGRLEDVPVTTCDRLDCSGTIAGSTSRFKAINRLSGTWGCYYADEMDHLPTPVIPSEEVRAERAKLGRAILERFADWTDIYNLVETMNEGDAYHQAVFEKHPWA